MVARGCVQNGVVVLDPDVCLPEGLEVIVLTREPKVANVPAKGLPPHSILDIPVVSLRSILRPLTSDDDPFGEMLECRS